MSIYCEGLPFQINKNVCRQKQNDELIAKKCNLLTKTRSPFPLTCEIARHSYVKRDKKGGMDDKIRKDTMWAAVS